MRLRPLTRARAAAEHGFAMATVVMGTVVASLVVLVAVTAVQGDLNVGQHDLDRKRAYAAAQAGLADYSFHLNKDTNYWSKCTSVPTPNAVNQMGSTTKRRPVPGDPQARYAIELIPATGQSSCSTTNPSGTMLESSGQSIGSFRIRSTGYAGGAQQRIVATYKRASFLDYVYFTQLETSDPETYPNASTVAGAYQQCTKTYAQGRLNAAIPNSNGDYCDVISFIDGETIEGPFHTNDAFVACGSPIFGRTPADAIEVSAPPKGWFSSCGGSNPVFRGTYVNPAPVLTPPPTNNQLAQVPGVRKFTGLTRIVLNGTNMTVTNNGSTFTEAVPSSGVIYVQNGSCSGAYFNRNPFKQTYPAPPSGCGTVIICSGSGSTCNSTNTYSSRLTIAAENDIIIEDDIRRTGDGLLGLIANNFIRVKHPICPSDNLGCTNGTITSQTAKGVCNSGVNGTGTQSNLRIDAALLAIQHSFIVDHYDCGAALGTLTVNGAISQKFRGAVGTFNGWGGQQTGYRKDYNYDDRLRYISPPYFLDPVQSTWHMQRQTLDP